VGGGFVIGAIFSAVAGDMGKSLLTWVWEHFAVFFWQGLLLLLRIDYWPWLFIAILLGFVFFLWWANSKLNRAFHTATNLLELDDSLLRTLGSWDSTLPHKMQLKRVLNELLRDAIREFEGNVGRGAVLLPDENVAEVLSVFASYKIPDKSQDMTFYVGSDSESREEDAGVAGMAFIEKDLRVAHMERRDAEWVCDDAAYKEFNLRERSPSYRSFICVPIFGPYDEAIKGIACLGVFVVDSMDKSFFDDVAPKIVLWSFSRRMALALLVCRVLSNPDLPERK
jgi:hypothetical protein